MTRKNRQMLQSLLRTEEDIEVVKALKSLTWQPFKNIDIRLTNNLTRNQVYYRLKQKLSWILNKTGLKWSLKEGVAQLITQLLDVLQNLEFLIGQVGKQDNEETYVDMFGIKSMGRMKATQGLP